ncbi:uncharacterized protein LOC119298945 isoform X2 [Triticum dicoccoides]|uniref:uncharacterized protein LOC119298945 isoform X2 n=1 Tax=Triticum dicoccoides TaxID=85692 RepID=UPI000E786C40|nr:uncharacterized protein LOC119298945 isoform X2 [Triticum dicoccoides]
MASSTDTDMLEEHVPVKTTTVQVKWCGNDYDVVVQSDADVGELKRRVEHDTELPFKRQRHINTQTNDELADNYRVSLLDSPPTTFLIGLNKPDLPLYSRYFSYDNTNRSCSVKAIKLGKKKDFLSDFHEVPTAFFRGTYTVGSFTTDCLLKWYDAKDKHKVLSSLRLMSTWRHPNVVVLQNIYKLHPDYRLIISTSSFDGTLNGWLKHGEKNKIEENRILNMDGKFTPVFSRITLDLLDILDKMIRRKMCPKDLTVDNLYLKTVNGQPQLKVFFDDGTRAYCDFIEKHGPDFIGKNLAKVAKFYPIEWDDEDKSKYLIDIFSSTRDCSAALNACGIRWPRNESEDDMCQELKTLKEMMERANIDNNKRKAALKLQGAEGRAAANKIREYIWNCDIDYPNDLVRLVRNLWKHFSTYPHYIKTHLVGSQSAVLRKFEQWCPDAWTLIYNTVGQP